MKASIEISLYPLSSDYKDRITAFIFRLREKNGVNVVTNGMSTQIFGEFEVLMDLLKTELGEELRKHRTAAILKITDGELTPESLPDDLK